MIDTSLFPYESFPVRLELVNENRIAWFKDNIDLQKYIDRYKIDKRKVKIITREIDGKSPMSGETDKNKIRQGTGKNSDRSASANRKRTKSVDTNSNIPRTRKSKKS